MPERGSAKRRKGREAGTGPRGGAGTCSLEGGEGVRRETEEIRAGRPQLGKVLLRRQGPRRNAEPKMRASVVLTCYCWLLVRVSEPAPTSRRGASCRGPLGSPPSPSTSRGDNLEQNVSY